jgi:hypothetical protein
MVEIKAGLYFTALRDTVATMMTTVGQVAPTTGVEDGVDPNGVVPADIVRALAHLRLLEGVPFNYLVPDAELTPAETIRFFYLDRNATDALVEGALSVGTVNSADRVQLAELWPVVRDEVDQAERLVRLKDADAPVLDAQGRPIGAGGPITGFVLRSRLVSGWPAMHVRAYAKDPGPAQDGVPIPDNDPEPSRIRLLRMERLAPAVLLVLFDGVPEVVHLEEPRAGIQFGVRLDDVTDKTQQTAALTVRDVAHPNNGPLVSGGHPRTVPVPFRAGAPGVVNMRALNAALLAVPGTNMGSTVDAAEFAVQMLRFPLRQVFGDTGAGAEVDAFTPTVPIATLTARFALARTVLEA